MRVFLFRADVLADRLHQVRLAQPDAAVNEERIVGAGRRLRDRETRRVRDLVVRTDDERLESVARIQAESAGAGSSRRAADRFRFLDFSGGTASSFRRPARSAGERELYRARPIESGLDRGLQRGHVVTLDPELVDIIRDAKRERFIGHLNQRTAENQRLKVSGLTCGLRAAESFCQS